MPKLLCNVCGNEKEVPNCCDRSMILKGEYLICCCSDHCGHQPIPECCGQQMNYIE
ncbi:MAG: hypothetical protein ACFFDK_11445 [Promethearchaeota archaeon]